MSNFVLYYISTGKSNRQTVFIKLNGFFFGYIVPLLYNGLSQTYHPLAKTSKLPIQRFPGRLAYLTSEAWFIRNNELTVNWK